MSFKAKHPKQDRLFILYVNDIPSRVFKRLWTLAFLTVSIISVISCKPSHLVSKQAFIIGDSNDIKKIEAELKDQQIKTARLASVLVATQSNDDSTNFCSGVIIIDPSDGEKAVLTNHHCFASSSSDNSASSFDSGACKRTSVYFGQFASKDPSHVAACVVGSLRSDYIGDVAVFKVEGGIGAEWPHLDLWDELKSLEPPVEAMVIHFPDLPDHRAPDNRSKRIIPLASMTLDNCLLLGSFEQKQWRFDRSLPYAYRHSCDLLGGSSGSALLHLQTNRIIGLNWGGIELKFSDRTEKVNVATNHSYIRAFLNNALENSRDTLVSRFDGQRLNSDANNASEASVCGMTGTSRAGIRSFGMLWLLLPILLIYSILVIKRMSDIEIR